MTIFLIGVCVGAVVTISFWKRQVRRDLHDLEVERRAALRDYVNREWTP